ncbi:hypothetical protein BU24DRAFT_422277 [Aaosphaeria arxii CBS 175.79]|uniref:LCCL domain-containing protein n=1 Tax=Aaosphaeria arxii CBS 175.79 TaxID=1450172 RepID=A0A6A5XTE8_9PLEO|nr:uncharacterized protein BU24DRAFT_422277 [Aaosphaeria arxii CBS 175.79]KAF2015960.1 hypothetical protein BU24DRAFT_422277 [Aaosphaeria arxii CBS 175.79]
MPSSGSKSKTLEPTVIDIENGAQTPNGSSLLTPAGETPEAITPNERLSYESERRARDTERPAPTRWGRLSDNVPAPIARVSSKVVDWVKGPEPPTVYRIKPLLEKVQLFPARCLSRLPFVVRLAILVAGFLLWGILFGVILSRFGLPTDIGGFGPPVRLSCISRLWPDSPGCGLDGRDCLPFDDAAFAFSCPAECSRAQVLNPRTIGDETIVYRSLVIGGTSEPGDGDETPYRGDSFICGAAVHAGVLDNGKGGCGVLSLTGEKKSYGSADKNGILSVGFNSSFPLSFDFYNDGDVSRSVAKCGDPRWNLLTLSTIFTAFFGLLTTNPVTFFVPVFVIVYFQVAMASDPPPYSDYSSLASTALGGFLPAAFIGVLIYKFSIRKTLSHLNAHIEKTILWVGACWVGALNNLTLDKIPIQRLTPHDIKQQPGAIVALVIIVLVIVAVAIYQAWCFRKEGRLPRYLGLYAILGAGLLICLGIPQLSLRIHHYILALLLLPGTALQTRPSLLYQGLLVGMFINGVARWGFAPILQTQAALRGDAQLGSSVPSILPPAIESTNITFTWESIEQGYEGVSVLVNDVERFRGFHEDGDKNFTWTRQAVDHPEYFRFGFVAYELFGGVDYSDFTRAGIWWPNGTWSDIPPGLS